MPHPVRYWRDETDLCSVRMTPGQCRRRAAYAVCKAAPLPARRVPRLLRVARLDWFIDSMKSEMRGTISERKREPLNTP